MQASLTALDAAFKHIQQYPSQAEDSGTQSRTTQHWLVNIRNTALIQKEICDTQALAALVGPVDALITTDSFVYFGPYDHIKEIFKQYDIFTVQSMHLKYQILHSTSKSTRLYVTKDGKKPISHCKHWMYRGEQLKSLSRYEYYTTIQIKKFTKTRTAETQPKSTQGRKLSTIYRVHPDHELYHSHYQCVHTKIPTLIPAGIPPSYPGPDPQPENARL